MLSCSFVPPLPWNADRNWVEKKVSYALLHVHWLTINDPDIVINAKNLSEVEKARLYNLAVSVRVFIERLKRARKSKHASQSLVTDFSVARVRTCQLHFEIDTIFRSKVVQLLHVGICNPAERPWIWRRRMYFRAGRCDDQTND